MTTVEKNEPTTATLSKPPIRPTSVSTKSRRPTELAWGRWLDDLTTPKAGGPLSPLERRLIANCKMGKPTEILHSEDPPTRKSKDNGVRASLIRFLVLGGDKKHPVHERGLELSGAWIDGEIDLFATRATIGLEFHFCSISRGIDAQYASLRSLKLNYCQLGRFHADGIKLTDDLVLAYSLSNKHIRLIGASIGGDLDASGVQLTGVDAGISLDRSIIKGDVFLSDGCLITGTVGLEATRISGDLVCSGGEFDGGADYSIYARGIIVEGDVLLCAKLDAVGNPEKNEDNQILAPMKSCGVLEFEGAQISGDLDLSGGSFIAGDPDRDAINFEGIEVADSLVLIECDIQGKIDLKSAYCGTLNDDPESWPKLDAAGNGLVTLNGFRYERIVGGATDCPSRLNWLRLQRPHYLEGETFAPQPWEQLIHVLREMGHNRDANQVALEKQAALAKAKRVGNRRPKEEFWISYRRGGWPHSIRCFIDKWLWNYFHNFLSRFAHYCYRILAGFGYRPSRILFWMLGVWLMGAWYFDKAAAEGIMAPTDSIVFAHGYVHHTLDGRSRNVDLCGVRGETNDSGKYWTSCQELSSEYTTFNAWVYSADLILPLVDLQQDSDWAPATSYVDKNDKQHQMPGSEWARLLLWFEILFGWVASLMFVAVVTRLVDRE